jgi:CRP-like cAMP-binding protein
MPKRKLTNMLHQLYQINKELRDLLEAEGTLRKQILKKKETLLRPKMDANELHYIYKGACKVFWKNENNEEIIFGFFIENEIVLLAEAFLLDVKNEDTFIEMITDSEIYTITKAQADEIYAAHPEAGKLTTLLRARISEKRNLQLKILMRREGDRFAFFAELFPELRNRLAEKDICAFLGISKTTLATSKRERLLRDRKRRKK